MNFLDHYLKWAAINESPFEYHVFSCFSLMSQIVGRRVYTDMIRFKIYPNMYCILTGPPGVAKSTAMDASRDFMRDFFPKMPMCPASITKEAIVQLMADKKGPAIQSYLDEHGKMQSFSQLAVFADEIISLLTCGGNPTGMIDFMTELFGCKSYRETTKNKGDNEIVNPYLSILACCTIETLKQLVQTRVVSGGMSRRCLFIVKHRGEKAVPWLECTPEMVEHQQICARMAQRLTTLSGPFGWDSDAKEIYTKWYEKNYEQANAATSSVLQHFLKTKPSYVIKFSMLLSLGQEDPQLRHTASNFERALSLITSVENGAQQLFDSQGRNELAAIADEVERFILDRGEVTLDEMKKRFWREFKNGDLSELQRIIEHLETVGRVIRAAQMTANGITTIYKKV